MNHKESEEEVQKRVIEDRAAANYWRARRGDWELASALDRRYFRMGAALEIACGL